MTHSEAGWGKPIKTSLCATCDNRDAVPGDALCATCQEEVRAARGGSPQDKVRDDTLLEVRKAIPQEFWGSGSKWPDGTDPYYTGGQTALKCIHSILDRLEEMPDAERIQLGGSPAGEPTDEQVHALQQALNEEPDPNELEGWDWDVCERLLTQALRAAASGSGPPHTNSPEISTPLVVGGSPAGEPGLRDPYLRVWTWFEQWRDQLTPEAAADLRNLLDVLELRAAASGSPQQKPDELVEFFRNEEVDWGQKGDYENWSTERAAIELIRVLRGSARPGAAEPLREIAADYLAKVDAYEDAMDDDEHPTAEDDAWKATRVALKVLRAALSGVAAEEENT